MEKAREGMIREEMGRDGERWGEKARGGKRREGKRREEKGDRVCNTYICRSTQY
jgi:hypothetical protein